MNIVPAGREVGAYLVEHPDVDKVAFTGSTAAGRTIARRCGELLRPVTLELGGKSAAIVLDDADLAGATEALFAATLLNNGQTCNIGTRMLAPRSRYDEVLEVFSGLAGALVRSATRSTPPRRSARWRAPASASASRATSRRAAPRADGSSRAAAARRSRSAAGSCSRRSSPTSSNSDTIAREEIFGPVLAVIPYDGVERRRRDRQRLRIRARRQRVDAATPSARKTSPGACRPAASASTTTCSTPPRRSAA